VHFNKCYVIAKRIFEQKLLFKLICFNKNQGFIQVKQF